VPFFYLYSTCRRQQRARGGLPIALFGVEEPAARTRRLHERLRVRGSVEDALLMLRPWPRSLSPDCEE
jgi:hypothetical protein